MCSAAIVQRRGATLQQVVDGWHGEGYRIGFGTLTVRHQRGQNLAELWDLVLRSFSRAITTYAWTKTQKAFGVAMESNGGVVRPRIPVVRTQEVMGGGRNGWHPHLHVLVFFDGGEMPDDRWSAIWAVLEAEYSRAMRKLGGDVIVGKGTDSELVDPAQSSADRVGQYLAKAVMTGTEGQPSAIHWEMTNNFGKVSRGSGSSTPWQMLADAADGDPRAFRLWREYEAASRGRRQMTISGALLSRYGLRDETDAEAGDAAGSEAESWLPGRDPAGPISDIMSDRAT